MPLHFIVMPMNKLRERKAAKEEVTEEASEDIQLLREIRDSLAR